MAAAQDVVFGCNGPVGIALMEELVRRRRSVRGVCRSGVSDAPAGAGIVAGDVADGAQPRRLAADAEAVYCCVGLPYPRWQRDFPAVIDGFLRAAEGRVAVFADNLYAYGPVAGMLREDLPPTDWGRKPALRARLAARLLAAHREGRTRLAIARASDFYGPRVRNAVLGERVFPAALAGGRAQLIGDIDQPHSYTYVPDFARALATLAGDARAHGAIWHVPNAPAASTRAVVGEVFRLAGTPARVTALPGWAIAALGLVSPLMRELAELRYQWERPFVVDDRRYREHFGVGHTELAAGLAATLAWYRRDARPRPA